jgi:hypothetical protein
MPSYAEVGDTERIDVAIDVSGSPVDPATLTLTIEAPDGTRTTETDADPDVVHDSAGRFHRLLTYTAAGMWAVRWVATSPAQSGGMRVFVRPDALAAIPRSLSLEELKRRVDHTMDADEDLLADDLVSAFMQAQRPAPYGTGRLLAPDPVSDTDDPVTRTILTTGRRVRVPDARSITAVTLDGTETTSYETQMRDGMVIQLALADDGNWLPQWCNGNGSSQRTVAITGRFGFASIPEDLAGAIYQLAARWHYEREAQYADQVEVLEGTAVQAYFRQLPPRVKLVFASYALPGGIGGLR